VKKSSAAQPSPRRKPVHRETAPVIARVAGVDDRGHLLVQMPAGPARPCIARVSASLAGHGREAAFWKGRDVVVVSDGDGAPVVVDLVEATLAPKPRRPASSRNEAVVDGKHVRFDAHDSVVLRCGNASISLMRDGTVQIRGKYISSRASGTNRIWGGSVQMN
jgi:hypothetical protein